MEAVIPEYTGSGALRQPSGTTVTGIVPTNTYRCSDGKYLIIGGNGDSIFRRLMSAIGREDMANDPELAENQGRVKHEALIDEALSNWCASLPIGEAIEAMEFARVPAGPIYSADDIVNDPQYQARGMLEEVEVEGKGFAIPAYSPKLEKTPGRTRWLGPDLGQHNEEIYHGLLGLDASRVESLKSKQVI